MAGVDYTVNGLLSSIKRRGMIPASSFTFTDDQLTAFLNDELLSRLVPAIKSVREEFLPVLADPQTSGGLLVAVDPHHQNEFEEILRSLALPESCCKPFGELHPVQNGKCIQVVD